MDDTGKDNRQPFELEETPPPKRGGKNRRKSTARLSRRATIIMLLALFAAMAALVFSQLGGDKPAEGPLVQLPERQTPSAAEGTGPASMQGAMPDAGQEAAGQQDAAGGEVTMPKQPEVPGQVQEPQDVGQPATVPGPQQVDEPAVQRQEGPRPISQEPQEQAPASGAPDGAADAEPAEKPEPTGQTEPAEPARQAPSAQEAAPTRQAEPTEQAKPSRTEPQQPPRKPATQKAAGPRNQLKNIRIRVEHTAVIMDIIADRPIEHYKFFGLENPQRKVVDLLGAFKPHAPTMQVPENNYVSGLRIGDHPDKLRIVADIKAEDRLKMQVERVSEKQIRLTVTR